MRLRLPASRGFFKIQLSAFDVAWAILTPVLALIVRDAPLLSYDNALAAGLYWLVSVAFSLIAFSAFRIRDGMTGYFSVHDAIDVAKAVLFAELMTCIFLFTFTRLDGVPRSIPIIHALILGAGLISARTFARLSESSRKTSSSRRNPATEHIVMIGSTQLSALYIKFLDAYSTHRRRVIAVLDDKPHMTGRSISGVRIVAPPQNLEPVIDEFAVHGLQTDRVIIGGDADLLSEEALAEIRRVCERRDIALDFVPRLLGLTTPPVGKSEAALEIVQGSGPNIALPPYHRLKRLADFAAAMALIIVLSPVFLLVGALVMLDVGSPVLFWQQRIGVGGRTFLLQKFRTLRPPFNWRGQPVAEAQRLSSFGRLLRKTCLDELPQLLNVLVGDMSLIGPRPLLPEDQPPNPAVRLTVRPGITGWAQVNGGKLLTPAEKDDLDEWYIRNASLWLDLRILVMTAQVVFAGERRDDQVLIQARTARTGRPAEQKRTAYQGREYAGLMQEVRSR